MKDQTPKLADLTDEQRRIAAAEALGWHVTKGLLCRGDMPIRNVGTANSTWEKAWSLAIYHIPNPDQSADDAMKLVEHMTEKGWRYYVSTNEWEGGHIAQFVLPDYSELHEGEEVTFQRAINSAFLLAIGKARQ